MGSHFLAIVLSVSFHTLFDREWSRWHCAAFGGFVWPCLGATGDCALESRRLFASENFEPPFFSSVEAAVLNKNILRVLPLISEANVMAEELKKDVKYDIQLLTPEMQGKLDGQTEVRA